MKITRVFKLFRTLNKYKVQARELSSRLVEKEKARLSAENNARVITDDYINIALIFSQLDEDNQRLNSIVKNQDEFISDLRNRIVLQEKEIKIACQKLTEARLIHSALNTDLSKAVKRCEDQIKEDAKKSLEHERTMRNLKKARRILNEVIPNIRNGWSKIDENLELEIQEVVKDVA